MVQLHAPRRASRAVDFGRVHPRPLGDDAVPGPVPRDPVLPRAGAAHDRRDRREPHRERDGERAPLSTCRSRTGASAFVRAEKTSSNETREAETLEMLTEEKPPKGYVNPFDRGVANNCLEFWRGHQERVDWDAQRTAVVLGEARWSPRGSYAWLHKDGGRAAPSRRCRGSSRCTSAPPTPPSGGGGTSGRTGTDGDAPCESCDGDHGAEAQKNASAPEPAARGHGHSPRRRASRATGTTHAEAARRAARRDPAERTRDARRSARAGPRGRADARGVSVAAQQADETARSAGDGGARGGGGRLGGGARGAEAAPAATRSRRLSVEQFEIVRESAARKGARRSGAASAPRGVRGDARGQAAAAGGELATRARRGTGTAREKKKRPAARRSGARRTPRSRPDAWKTHGTREEVPARRRR